MGASMYQFFSLQSIYSATYICTCLCTIYLPIYVSIYLSIYLSTYLSIYLSMYLCIYLSIYLSIIIHPSTTEGSTIQKAISSPSQVRAGWKCLVAGSGRREVSSHTPTAVPAAMAAPRTVISQKSGRSVCICECVTQCDKHCHLTKVRANCVYMWMSGTGERRTRERGTRERGTRDEGKDRERGAGTSLPQSKKWIPQFHSTNTQSFHNAKYDQMSVYLSQDHINILCSCDIPMSILRRSACSCRRRLLTVIPPSTRREARGSSES